MRASTAFSKATTSGRRGGEVKVEIDQRRGGVFDRGEALVEGARGEHLLQHRFRHGLAGLGMDGEPAQHLGLLEPVLVELRGQLYEIGGDAGAGEQRIGDVRQQAVEGMAELMEEGAGVVEGEQRRLALRRLGEVHDIDDDRPDIAAIEPLLVAEAAHPGAAALRRAGEVVAHEQADEAAIPARNRPDPDIGVIERDVVDPGEAQPEEAGGGVEGGLDHLVELEIGLELGLVEIEAALAELLGVVAPVGRGEVVVAPSSTISASRSAASRVARARPRVQTVSSSSATASGDLAIWSARRKWA